MKLMVAVVVAAGCGSSSSKSVEPSCGVGVKLVSAQRHRVELEFDNVTSDTVRIGGSSRAAFVDLDGNAMSAVTDPGSDDWFQGFSLPTDSHRRVRVKLSSSGDGRKLDRIEVPDSGRTQSCTIRIAGLVATKSDRPSRGSFDDAIDKMAEFSNRMCQCKDKPCADRVQDDMTKWGTEMAKNASPDADRPDPDMVKKSGEIMTKYTECMTKLMTMDMGGGMAGSDIVQ
jgi:hypothetical protein